MKKNKIYWLGLSLVEGLGPIRLSKALSLEPDPRAIWQASPNRLKILFSEKDVVESLIKTREKIDLKARMEILNERGLKLICREDDSYPGLLDEIYDPPPVLIVKGELPAEFPAVAIVGSRRSTRYGEKAANQLSRELGSRGIVVVSGMAEGIDRQAHVGAMEDGGKTVAVLGCGHNFCYPNKNSDIFKKIPLNGAVISEFWLDARPQAGNFPRRNRIISGLSQGTVVVEAAKRSGALITSGLALDQNREVFAVPGNIDRPTSKGCNDLLCQGAIPVTSADDIITHLYSYIEEKNEDKTVIIPPDFSPLEREIIKLFNRERELGLEELISFTGREAGELSSILLNLEVRGVITRLSGQKYYFEGLQTLLKPI